MRSEVQIAWLAGLLEGEGSFGFSSDTVYVFDRMTDKDVVQRAAILMGSKRITSRSGASSGRQTTYGAGVYGRTAMDLMRDLSPHLGARRLERVEQLISDYGDRYGDRVCGGCGKTFTPTRSLQRSCSRSCWNKIDRRRKQEAA